MQAKKKISPREAAKTQAIYKCKRCLQTFAGSAQRPELVTHCESRHAEFKIDYCFPDFGAPSSSGAKSAEKESLTGPPKVKPAAKESLTGPPKDSLTGPPKATATKDTKEKERDPRDSFVRSPSRLPGSPTTAPPLSPLTSTTTSSTTSSSSTTTPGIKVEVITLFSQNIATTADQVLFISLSSTLNAFAYNET
eukprot:TRINITY_DN28909_c0_g1_i8.p1 TRINITY_DN28909_c0_g1~~TRINITY_DN28909_c0_g1_i8.p1  ORF type:complete len:194 (-),score=21.75 TRINITY_DN28909_c0_g1_i8:42-623(-)